MSWGDILSSGASGATNWMQSFLHPEDAYKKARAPYNAGWEETKSYNAPFLNAGINQIGRLNTAENALLDPAKLQSDWAGGYETSPYAKQLMDQAKGAGLDAASSQGLLGSSASINNIQQGASNIMQQDRQKYMDDLMSKYMAGIGIGGSMYGTGAGTASNLGNLAMKHGEGEANLAYGEQNAPGELFKSMLNAAIKASMGNKGN